MGVIIGNERHTIVIVHERRWWSWLVPRRPLSKVLFRLSIQGALLRRATGRKAHKIGVKYIS
jgi:hypothetical protein